MSYYDRYKNFREDGQIKLIKFCNVPSYNTDKYITFDKRTMRLDMLSYMYYNDPNYGWLILQANPHLPSMEFSIPNGVTLRIPYPLDTALKGYEYAIERYKQYNDTNNRK